MYCSCCFLQKVRLRWCNRRGRPKRLVPNRVSREVPLLPKVPPAVVLPGIQPAVLRHSFKPIAPSVIPALAVPIVQSAPIVIGEYFTVRAQSALYAIKFLQPKLTMLNILATFYMIKKYLGGIKFFNFDQAWYTRIQILLENLNNRLFNRLFLHLILS